MAFQAYLENLKARPEHIRRRFALLGSLGITAVIFMFWLASFSSLGIKSGAQNAVASAAAKVSTPSQSLVAGVGAFAGDIWSMITGPRKVTYSTVEVVPGTK